MNALKTFLKRLRTKSRRWAKWLWLLVPVLAIALLTHQSSRETDARKTPATLQFERSPSDWLKNPRDASELFKAIDAGQVASVAQAKDQPGLVLFTLKSGAKASTTIPGCTMFSCSGTPLDKLAERSASQGFALVSADIDRLTLSGHILSFLD